MFTEKTKLVDRRDKDNPFYGSYKENDVLEELHWKNKRKRQQLAMVSAVVMILVILSIGITLAITLPALLESMSLDPPDPVNFLDPSPSILREFQNAGVSSDSGVCSEMGRNVMETKGGSAVDAAVAVTLCHGVTNPVSSGLGGGLFMVIYAGNETLVLNAREVATAKADPTIYENDAMASVKGGLAVGVPGELAGLWEAHARFGKVAWSELVSPVRELAENGVTVSTQLAISLKQREKKIKEDPIMSSEFINPTTGSVWAEGELLKRPRLANTLRDLEQNGASAFYNGSLATEIVREVGAAKGNMEINDLSDYRPEWDTAFEYPLTSNLTMYAMPFPSSGPVVAMALGILHRFGKMPSSEMDWKARGIDEHQLVEVLKFAHAYRAQIADPDFTDMSEITDLLLSSDLADELKSLIDPYKTFDDPKHYGAAYSFSADQGTSHISILGPNGDAVSVTTSINWGLGAGFMGDTTGIIYNNVMSDFSIGNGSDVYGLSPNPLNEIEPGKRPASSMSPLIVVNDQGTPVLATGASGGEQILSSVISTTWRALYRYMDIKAAIDYPRFMPSFNPSNLYYEYGLPAPIISELKRRGHHTERLDQVAQSATYLGDVNAVCLAKQSGNILGNADERRRGGDSAGY